MAGALVGATSGSVGLVDDGPGPHGVGASVFTPMSLALVAAGLGLAARTALGCGAQMLEWGLVVAGVGVGLAQSFGIATAMDTVPAEAEGSGAALLAAEEEDWLEKPCCQGRAGGPHSRARAGPVGAVVGLDYDACRAATH